MVAHHTATIQRPRTTRVRLRPSPRRTTDGSDPATTQARNLPPWAAPLAAWGREWTAIRSHRVAGNDRAAARAWHASSAPPASRKPRRGRASGKWS